MMLADIFTFSGRLHPLVVHLPIGFILLATVFDLLAYTKKYRHLKEAVPVTLLFGFVAAILACVFGYILSLSGDYDKLILKHHKFSGITLAAIAGFLFFCSTTSGKANFPMPSKIYSLLLVGVIGLMSYSGHQGANLTHGNDYLSMRLLLQQQRPKPASVEKAMVFEDVVHPILQNKCGQCHREGKLKGKLSVETIPLLLKGGKTGPAIIPGQADSSELMKRVTLDPDHKDFMPADGKPPLTKNEIAIIRWWIRDAAASGGKTVPMIKNWAAIKPRIAFYLGLGELTETDDGKAATQRINPDIPPTVNNTLTESLRKKGLMIRVMQKTPMMLDITVPSGSGIKADDIKKDIQGLAKNIVWMNLSGNAFRDQDLDFLTSLQNVEKLRIDENPVTNEVCKYLTGLKHLEAVNVNNTQVNDDGIAVLKKNPSIKRIYSWKEKI